MAYEHLKNKEDFLLFLDFEKIAIDSELKDLLSKLFDNHTILHVEKTGEISSGKFHLNFLMSRKKMNLVLNKEGLSEPNERIIQRLKKLSLSEPLNIYSTDSLLPLCAPLTKYGFVIEDQIEYKIRLTRDNESITIDLTPSDLSGHHGRSTLYSKQEGDDWRYVTTIASLNLKSLEDVKSLIDKTSLDLEKRYNKEESEELSEELYNLGCTSTITLEKLGSNTYAYIVEDGNVVRCLKGDTTIALEYLIDRANFKFALLERDDSFDQEKNLFLQKDYEILQFFSQDGVDKLYDFFINHDLSVSDIFYEYLKEATKNGKLISIDFKKSKIGKKLEIKFSEGDLNVELEPEFSHYINKKPIFFWKPINYIGSIQSIKKITKVKTEKADMIEIKMSNIYKKLLKYGLKDISTKEDNIKRRIFLNKGLYTYQIFSDGKIILSYEKRDRSHEIVLEDGYYLQTVEEYEQALSKVFVNYAKFSKEYGFQTA